MYPAVRDWLKLRQAISFIDNWTAGKNTPNTGRHSASPEWKQLYYSLSGVLTSLLTIHLQMQWPKKRARCWSVRMIHCQFAKLFLFFLFFIKVCSVQEPVRWTQPPSSFQKSMYWHLMIVWWWLGASLRRGLSSKSFNSPECGQKVISALAASSLTGTDYVMMCNMVLYNIMM